MSASIVVPQLGESVVEARVARWLKAEGDAVSVGEPVVELETEKIDVEVGAERSGVLAKIVRQAGEDVKVGEQLGTIEESQEAGVGKPETGSGKQETGLPRRSSPEASEGGRTTPTAKRVAAAHAVDVATVPPSGEAGRVMRRDVESFVDRARRTAEPAETTASGAAPARPVAVPRPTAAPPAAAPRRVAPGERGEERSRMSKRRLTIARNLVTAQQTAAMLTTFNEVDMSAIIELRKRRKEAFQKQYGVSLGITSFFVKAAIGALRAFPRLNGEIQGEEIVLKHYYDIGVAVGAEGGLVVPVLHNAELMTFVDMERAVQDFATRSREGQLTLEDLRGGTFTITNGGVFGSLLSTPILNPPQVGILGLHKMEERPIAVSGQVVVKSMMYVALTYDHRMVDGREAVQFLVKIKEFIEDPGQLLLES
ncbi:MAG: 2-oxoglutarate dehydrogenase complex dihydrolipoyllysine-residue succinyltransferase [Luteitalea sp.]|nr:2-oxoglutarate dehydrogenase complex dihydrolipoyllysine-residue succinyltransferase [Luteitalea sp.]